MIWPDEFSGVNLLLSGKVGSLGMSIFWFQTCCAHDVRTALYVGFQDLYAQFVTWSQKISKFTADINPRGQVTKQANV